MPSPQLVPAPLSSPPPFPRRISSRSRLHLPSNPNEPPCPPRLVGSPLLEKLSHQPSTLSPKVQQQLWFDGDEFGTRSTASAHSDSALHSSSYSSPPTSLPGTPRTPSSGASRRHRRSSSVTYARRSRSRSPPPPPQSAAAPPPVPPIPSSAFDSPGARRPVLRTPPTTPPRAHTRIVFPDLPSSSSAPAPYVSRTISPRRRGLGFPFCGHSHSAPYLDEPACAWRPPENHARVHGRAQTGRLRAGEVV